MSWPAPEARVGLARRVISRPLDLMYPYSYQVSLRLWHPSRNLASAIKVFGFEPWRSWRRGEPRTTPHQGVLQFQAHTPTVTGRRGSLTGRSSQSKNRLSGSCRAMFSSSMKRARFCRACANLADAPSSLLAYTARETSLSNCRRSYCALWRASASRCLWTCIRNEISRTHGRSSSPC